MHGPVADVLFGSHANRVGGEACALLQASSHKREFWGQPKRSCGGLHISRVTHATLHVLSESSFLRK